jgi:hypothetical protein
MSFRMVRAHHEVEIVGGMTVTLPTVPPICPAGPLGAAARFYERASYGGPGAPPLVIFHLKPRELFLGPDEPGDYSRWIGTLRNRRTMVLTLDGGRNAPVGCGWKRRLHWVVRHLPRVPVAAGAWAGTVTAPGLIGSVNLTVGAAGHIVEAFAVDGHCADGTGGGGSVDTNHAQEFIDRRGRFAGPIAPASGVGWEGTFAGGMLRGTVALRDDCADGAPGAVRAQFVAHSVPAGARSARARAPLTGNWEGSGSRGVAMSFRLGRVGRRIDVVGGLTVTMPTAPVLCPAGPRTAAAVFFAHPEYLGPGSPPISIFHFGARTVELQDLGGRVSGTWAGTLRNRQTMVLTAPGVTSQRRGCGWPRRLRWVVRHVGRVHVANGSWTGTMSGPGVSGTIHVHVTAHGHIVDAFLMQATCTAGGPAPPGADASGAEEFIDRHGRFAGPLGPNTVNGVQTGWNGRFAGDTLTGTVTMFDQCARPPHGALVATFIAQPAPA